MGWTIDEWGETPTTAPPRRGNNWAPPLPGTHATGQVRAHSRTLADGRQVQVRRHERGYLAGSHGVDARQAIAAVAISAVGFAGAVIHFADGVLEALGVLLGLIAAVFGLLTALAHNGTASVQARTRRKSADRVTRTPARKPAQRKPTARRTTTRPAPRPTARRARR